MNNSQFRQFRQNMLNFICDRYLFKRLERPEILYYHIQLSRHRNRLEILQAFHDEANHRGRQARDRNIRRRQRIFQDLREMSATEEETVRRTFACDIVNNCKRESWGSCSIHAGDIRRVVRIHLSLFGTIWVNGWKRVLTRKTNRSMLCLLRELYMIQTVSDENKVVQYL